ncbi:MAG: YigZ family protein [Lachnospiraceae bacterium]|nr:YigZ family protein [Lachnospiraceae bacterium]
MADEKTAVEKIVFEDGEGYYEEKKSRFLSELHAAHSEEEALVIVESVRKKYYDAKHHVFAYRIGEKGDLMRAADDGEPQGTAGRPILDVLTGQGIHDAVLVVTRYFGGTLLGTGGLTRAYSKAAGDAVEKSLVLAEERGEVFDLIYPYDMAGKVEYLFRNSDGILLSQDYGSAVKIRGILPEERAGRFFEDLRNLSKGSLSAENREPCRFVRKDGKGILLAPEV